MAKTRNIQELKSIYASYWKKRSEKKFLAGEKEALRVAKALKNNYSRAYKEIEKKLQLFYGKYAAENGLSYEEATKLFDKRELKEFKAYIKDLLAMGKKENFTDEQMASFKKTYAKAKVSRLQELQTNIEYELDKLTNLNTEQIQQFLEETYGTGYYETIFDVEQFRGFASSFSSLNTQAVGKAVMSKYKGEDFSKRLWQNQNNLMAILQEEIPRGIALGYNPKKLADLTSNKLGTNYNNTVRVVRTEYNRIMNEATYDGYRACGITKYKLLATLDNRTSEICQEMDSKVFDFDVKEVGVNYPPFHPNCRTTTIPYFEPDEFDVQNAAAFNDKLGIDVPLDISYKEWKENLTQPRDSKTHYKGGE